MGFVVRQTHSVDGDGVKEMIADHYARMGMSFHPSYVSFQVHASSSGGLSSSSARLGDTTVVVPESIRRPGAPARMVLRADDVQAIVAARLSEMLGFEIAGPSVTLDVRDGGGSGFSRTGPSLAGATVVSRLQSNG
jgi:hypothetical protein